MREDPFRKPTVQGLCEVKASYRPATGVVVSYQCYLVVWRKSCLDVKVLLSNTDDGGGKGRTSVLIGKVEKVDSRGRGLGRS